MAKRQAQAGIAFDKAGISGARVLAVDNDPSALLALKQLLEGWGCVVVTAVNGEQAHAALATQPVDLWLFDYHLDDGDTGVALLQRLAEKLERKPCLILTADQTGAVRMSVREADVSLLSKPLRPLALKSVLDRLLAARTAPA